MCYYSSINLSKCGFTFFMFTYTHQNLLPPRRLGSPSVGSERDISALLHGTNIYYTARLLVRVLIQSHRNRSLTLPISNPE